MKGFENNVDFCKMCFDNDSKKMRKTYRPSDSQKFDKIAKL